MRCLPFCILLAALSATPHLLAQPAPAVRGFGSSDDEEALPGFGNNKVTLPKLTDNDRNSGENMLRRFDRNRSGDLSREELSRYRYAPNFLDGLFRYDLDGNNRVSSEEMAYFYANAREVQLRKKQEATRAKQEAMKFRITTADVDNARAQIKKFDRNNDRMLDKKEAAAIWGNGTAKIFEENDLNRSGYLISNELARHYANSRISQKNQKTVQPKHTGLVQWQVSNARLRQYIAAQQKAQSTPAKVMIARYDTNGNGALERYEQERIEGSIQGADTDQNGILTHEELSIWLQKQGTGLSTVSSASANDWFTRRDTNGDQQVSMSEYSSQWSDAKLQEFAKFDHNGDGLISLAESRSQQKPNNRSVEFASRSGAVIEPGIGASLNIPVSDDFEIADVNVRLSISHPAPVQLDAVLISPSGQRINLFNGEGKKWEGPNMEDTVFDDEAEKSVVDAAPPFRVSLIPEGAQTKEKRGLSSLYGQRCTGQWRLLVYATRSDKPGLLNGWKLEFVPKAPVEKRADAN